VGNSAGLSNQTAYATAVGVSAGAYNQKIGSVAVGANAANFNQSQYSVAVGQSAGYTNQGVQSVAIGNYAGGVNQGNGLPGIAIGVNAGSGNQGSYAISIGTNSAATNQGSFAVAVGSDSGNTNQGSFAVAVGQAAGLTSQGYAAVAIGTSAGQSGQGQYAVAIGAAAGYAGATGPPQPANSIVISAVGGLQAPAANTCVISSIRTRTINGTSPLYYQVDSGEVCYYSGGAGGTKTFVIQHPLDPEKYLVHACLEGPEAGVYYRGTGTIPAAALSLEITLPPYVDALAYEFTVHATPILTGETEFIPSIACSRVKEGKFKVFKTKSAEACMFDYVVFGNRFPIEVEPRKADVTVKGDGPYTWL